MSKRLKGFAFKWLKTNLLIFHEVSIYLFNFSHFFTAEMYIVLMCWLSKSWISRKGCRAWATMIRRCSFLSLMLVVLSTTNEHWSNAKRSPVILPFSQLCTVFTNAWFIMNAWQWEHPCVFMRAVFEVHMSAVRLARVNHCWRGSLSVRITQEVNQDLIGSDPGDLISVSKNLEVADAANQTVNMCVYFFLMQCLMLFVMWFLNAFSCQKESKIWDNWSSLVFLFSVLSFED